MEHTVRRKAANGFFAPETGTATLLGLIFGVMMFDRGAIGLLAPFFVGELHLSHAQLGIAASATSVTWALAAFPVARAADRAGRLKPFLLAAIICFTVISSACGLATGFISLLIIRLGLGLAEGPVPPLVSKTLLGASSAHRRGLNMSILTFLKSLVANALAPLVLVGLAGHFGWRPTFFLIAVPGFLVAIAVALWLRDEPVRPQTHERAPAGAQMLAPIPVRDLLRNRNVVISMGIGTLLLAFSVVVMVFLPLYLVKVRHLSPGDMGLVMTAVGAAGLAGSALVPALSDYLGRRAVLAIAGVSGLVLPLGCFYWNGGVVGLAALCAVAGLPNMLVHIGIGMVPSESVAPKDRGAATALVSGTGELIGGFATSSVAGLLADHAGLGAALVLGGACGVGAALLALCLRETAPRFSKPVLLVQPALETA